MQEQNFQNQQMISAKSKGTAAVLCFFFGWLGIHRFYVGKIGTGILWMLPTYQSLKGLARENQTGSTATDVKSL